MNINKLCKANYKVLDIIATNTKIKANKTDQKGDYYIYDLFDANGNLIALNRYIFKDVDEQPFDSLTKVEELELNPVIEIEKK